MNKWYGVGFLVVVSFFCGASWLMAQPVGGKYMVVTLPDVPGEGSSITYLDDAPNPMASDGGWTDEDKTEKLVLRRIDRGTFGMGTGLTPTEIDDDFYIGVFEVTVGQFARLRSGFTADDRTNTTAMTYYAFFDQNFFSALNASVTNRTELPTTNSTAVFGLPPAAAWEYACRAGSTNNYHFGSDPSELDDYAWYNANSGYVVQGVGEKWPNAWGLYDTLGNVAELVEGDRIRGGAFMLPAADCYCTSNLPRSGLEEMTGLRVYFRVPTERVTLTVINGTPASGSYTNGQSVLITADAPPAVNERFDRWTGDGVVFDDATNPSTTLIMPGTNTTVTATYRLLPQLTVVNGTVGGLGSGYFTNGVTVEVSANPTNAPWMFSNWTGPAGVVFADPTDATTTFVMPDANITVTATYKSRPILTVVGGSGSGQYETGERVPVSAAPPPTHFTFRWQGHNVIAEAAVDDLSAWNTMLTMPGFDITLTATYSPVLYPVTVTGGSGSGNYTNGHVMTIVANAAPTALHVFDKWVGDTGVLADALAPTATVTVDVAARLAATYRPLPVMERTYLVVNLATGGSSYTNEAPAGGWNSDLYKNSLMVFQKVPAGTFTMGGNTGGWPATANQVTLTEAFYMGLFQVTQAQWYFARNGQWPNCFFSGPGRDMRPVESVSYAMLRGAEKGAEWPASADIDAGSFIASMRTKAGAGVALDLPTEAQWEYVCRAGTTTPYSFDTAALLGDYAWFVTNAGGTTQPVGTKAPNPWGFYDMHGNVNEWCLDWYSGDYGSAPRTNPKGGTGSQTNERIVRGGGYSGTTNDCLSARRAVNVATNALRTVGFRLAWTVGVEHSLAVTNGVVNTGGRFVQGMQIPITAEDRGPAWRFLRWEVLPAGTALGSGFNANNVSTIVTMPNRAVALTATYQVNDGYTALTVVGGEGTGHYTNGTVVTIEADAPEQWYVFDRWTGNNVTGVADVNAATTDFTASGGAVTLTATYKIMDPLPPGVHLLTTIGNGVSKTIPVQGGASAPVTAPPPPSAAFAFGWWVVDPEGTPLGSGFNANAATTSVTMPDSDVTLTAIYVRDPGPTPGFLNIRLVDGASGTNLVTALWSTDGRDFVAAAANYPLRPGSYTLRFRAPNSNWLTPANASLTIRAGQTATLTVPFAWVPVVTGVASGGAAGDTVTLSPASGQVLPGRVVTLTARPTSASVFVEWTDGVASASRQVAPVTNATYTAIFRLKSSYTTPPVLSPGAGTTVPTVGTLFSYAVGINERPATFRATKLPPGLRINSATGEISGIPTKPGVFPVTVTATNPNRLSTTETVMIDIAPLSPYVQGSFSGYLTNATAEVVGVFTMKASATGSLSVKATVRNAAVSFSTKGWLETDGVVYTAQFQTKKDEHLSLNVDTSTWEVSGSTVGGKIGLGVLTLNGRWDLFKANKKSPDYPFVQGELAKYQGYYTVALPVADCEMLTVGLGNIQEGAGYLALTVNKSGGVKVAGRLSDGTSVSASTTLLLVGANEAVVPVFAPLYSKRGVASGLLTVQTGITAPNENRIIPGVDVVWQWLYPGRSATATLDGFGTALEPFGAFYAKVASIEEYYSGTSFITDVDSVTMDIPLVFNARGAATLTTEVADNPIGAKLTVKPATGIFNGTFLRLAPGATKAATVKYLGVLTRDGLGEPVGSGAYVLPQTERVGSTSYNLKPSYPVTIE